MKTEMTFDEMTKCLEVWDQTIGCSNCGEAYWGENEKKGDLDWHAEGCPLQGREDVAAAAPFGTS